MSRKEEAIIAVGGTPRADLMPVAVKEAIRRRPIVRRLIALVAFVAILTLAAVAGATYLSLNAQNALAAEQARSEQLLAQQLEFAEARAVSGDVDEAIAGRQAATQLEVDWEALLTEIRGTLPEGLLLVRVDGGTRAVGGEEEPLRQDSIGSFRIEANSPTVPDVETWLANLESVPGFAGIAPPVTVSGSDTGTYSVSLEFLIDETIFLERFAPADAPEAEGDGETTEGETTEGEGN